MVLALGLSQYVVAGLVVAFLLVSLILILTILIQRPQGGGLSGAFGSGGGAGQTAFGTRTGDALTTATIAMFVIYLGVAVGLNFALRPPEAAPADTAAEEAGLEVELDDGSEATGEDAEGEPGAGADADAGADSPEQPTQTPEAPAADTPGTPEDDGVSDDG